MRWTRPDAQRTNDARLLAGRYSLLAPIGKGRSTVYRAEDTRLRRPVAVKEVLLHSDHEGHEGHDRVRRRALREAQAAARLNNPSVVTVYDVVEEDGAIWLVMELVDAPSLSQLVAGEGPLDHAGAARIGLDVLSALDAAHAVGVVHRDVKPANVLVIDDGRHAKLADFGVATLRDEARVTATGLVIGSPAYMAPEQARGDDAGPAADLWALGATLYFAYEGQPPFDGGSAMATATAVVHGRPRTEARPGSLSAAVGRLLDKEPSRRPTAGQLRKALLRSISSSSPSGSGPASAVVVPAPAPGGSAGATGVTQHYAPADRPSPAPAPAEPSAPVPTQQFAAPPVAPADAAEPAPLSVEPSPDPAEAAAPVPTQQSAVPGVLPAPPDAAQPAIPSEELPADQAEPAATEDGPSDRSVPPAAPETAATDVDEAPPAAGPMAADFNEVLAATERAAAVPTERVDPAETPLEAAEPTKQVDAAGAAAPITQVDATDGPAGVAAPTKRLDATGGAGGAAGAAVPTTRVDEAVAPTKRVDVAGAAGPGGRARDEDSGGSASGVPPLRTRERVPGQPSRTGPVLVALLLVVAAVALWGLTRGGNDPDEDGAQSGPSADEADDQAPADTSATTAEAADEPEPTTTAPTTTEAEAEPETPADGQAPDGWQTYTQPDAGYTIAYPEGWEVVPAGGPRIDFRDPETGSYLRVDWTTTPKDDPVADWRQQTQSFAGRHEGYEEIGIAPYSYRDYNAALWEFRYSNGGSRLHVGNLGFVTGDRGFALYFQTDDARWAESQPLFDQFRSSFQPTA